MTIRILVAAALLSTAAVTAGAQGWGGEGSDPNHAAAAAASAPASKPAVAPKEEKKAKAAPAKAVPSENSDGELERARALVDKQLAARKTRLAQRTYQLSNYHMAMEKDSLEAEKGMAEERKAFLLYLKSVPQEDRAKALKDFEDRMDSKRHDLDKRHLQQYRAWFDENIAKDWRTEPLSTENVVVAAEAPAPTPAVAMQDAPAAAPAAAAPKTAAPAVRAKVKKRSKR